MIYSQQEILSRIKKTLPSRWFSENTPVLDLLLNALAAGWVGLFSLLNFVTLQTRISTSVGIWLDLAARDFFGHRLRRRQRETDFSYQSRICKELLRDRCTRPALSDLLLDLTGQPATIFEPGNPQDTGCYGSLSPVVLGMTAYNAAGGWGSLQLPFQTFVRAMRPVTPGVAMVNGWGGFIGGYGMALSSYISPETNTSEPDDQEICREITRIAPAGAIVWISITP
jgi:hypothetical protein